MLVTQLCPTLCDPVDYSPPGSSVHGILQARILEWVAIPFSRGSSRPRDGTWVSPLQADSLPSEPPGKPIRELWSIKVFMPPKIIKGLIDMEFPLSGCAGFLGELIKT